MANVNKPNNRHIPTLALNMLFYANNEGHRRFQTTIGVYLHTSGVPTRVIEALSQYGISVGLDSLESIMENLAKDQTARLLAYGREMTTRQLTICYDNINIHEKKNQLRTDNKNHQYNGITGFVATAIGGRPPPTRDSICPPPEIDPSLFSMREQDSEYYEIVRALVMCKSSRLDRVWILLLLLLPLLLLLSSLAQFLTLYSYRRDMLKMLFSCFFLILFWKIRLSVRPGWSTGVSTMARVPT